MLLQVVRQNRDFWFLYMAACKGKDYIQHIDSNSWTIFPHHVAMAAEVGSTPLLGAVQAGHAEVAPWPNIVKRMQAL